MDTWSNTLNTIAQSLSSIFGLIAVFFILRAERIIAAIVNYKDDALTILRSKEHHISAYNAPADDDVNGILKHIKVVDDNFENEIKGRGGIESDVEVLVNKVNDRNLHIPFTARGYISYIHQKLNYHIDQRDGMLNLARGSTINSVSTIIVIFVSLALTDVIKSGNPIWCPGSNSDFGAL